MYVGCDLPERPVELFGSKVFANAPYHDFASLEKALLHQYTSISWVIQSPAHCIRHFLLHTGITEGISSEAATSTTYAEQTPYCGTVSILLPNVDKTKVRMIKFHVQFGDNLGGVCTRIDVLGTFTCKSANRNSTRSIAEFVSGYDSKILRGNEHAEYLNFWTVNWSQSS